MKLKLTFCQNISRLFFAFTAASVLAVSSAHAQILINNYSFETGDLTGFSQTLGSGYGSSVNVVSSTSEQSSFPNYTDPLPIPADGHDYLNVTGSGDISRGNNTTSDAFQDVGTLQANTTYTFNVAVGIGAFNYSPAEGYVSLVNGTDDTGTVLSTAELSSQVPYLVYQGVFYPFSLTFTTGSVVAGDLTIVLAAQEGFDGAKGHPGISFDNLSLDSAVAAAPEPSSYLLLLLSLAGLWIFRRRLAPARR